MTQIQDNIELVSTDTLIPNRDNYHFTNEQKEKLDEYYRRQKELNKNGRD